MSATLSSLYDRRARGDDRTVLVSSDQRLDADAMLRAIELAAEQLSSAGIGSLAISADNSPDWIIADLAAQRAGVIVVPVPPFFSLDQVAHLLTDSGVDAIAADELGSTNLAALPTRYQTDLTEKLALLRLNGPSSGLRTPAGTAKVSYTSGTTSHPKGVCLSADALDRVACGVYAATEPLGIGRHLCLLPLATLLENVAGAYTPLIAGAEVAIPYLSEVGWLGSTGIDTERLVACLHHYAPESIIVFPQMLQALVGAVEQGHELPGSLKLVAVGGAVVGDMLLRRAEAAGVPVYEGYGLTECGSVVALNTPTARRIGSVGRPLPHCTVRIGPDSEVFVRGARMSGYLGEAGTPGSEIATGDIGRFDADGFLYIEGRKKNVLITSFGRNLSPEWVEASLTSMPSIAQAAVFGDGKPFCVAVVVPRPGSEPRDIEADINRMNRSLPDYARVRNWVLAKEAFRPVNGLSTENGRIRREGVHAQYESEIEACYCGALETNARQSKESGWFSTQS